MILEKKKAFDGRYFPHFLKILLKKYFSAQRNLHAVFASMNRKENFLHIRPRLHDREIKENSLKYGDNAR